MRSRRYVEDPSSQDGHSSQSIRHSIFETRCRRELSDLKSSINNQFIELNEPSLESEPYGSEGQNKAYRIEISFQSEFFKDARERYFEHNPSSKSLDQNNPMNEMAEFWLEIYKSYPFEPPLIQCVRFPSYLPGSKWLQFSPPSMIQFVMGESWLPLITLKILINRLIQCVEQSMVEYLQDLEYVKSLPNSKKGIKFRKLLEIIFGRFYYSNLKCFTLLFSVLTLITLRLFIFLNLSDFNLSGAVWEQWNWMMTVQNNPIKDWYKNDHLALPKRPPLFALYSYCMAQMIKFFEPINTDSQNKQTLINFTIMVSELLVLISGAIVYWSYNPLSGNQLKIRLKSSWVKSHICLFLFLSCPTFIMIDYTQFHYTCVALGLLIWSICFISYRQYSLAVAVFTMALLFDPMMIFLLVPFLNFLLAISARRLIATGIKTNIQLQNWRKLIPRFSMIFFSFMVILVIFTLPFKLHQELSFIGFFRGILPIWDFTHNTEQVLNFSHFLYTFVKVPSWAKHLANVCAILFMIPSNLDLMFKPTFQRFLFTLFSSSLSVYTFASYTTSRLIVLPLLCSFLLYTRFARASLLFSLISSFSLLTTFKTTYQLIFGGLFFIIWYTLALNCVSIFDPRKSYPPKYKSWFSLMKTFVGLCIQITYNYMAYFITSSMLFQLLHTVLLHIIIAIKETYKHPSTHPFILSRWYLKCVRFFIILNERRRNNHAHTHIYFLHYQYHSNNWKKTNYRLKCTIKVTPKSYYYTLLGFFFLFLYITGIILQYASINNPLENWPFFYLSMICSILFAITLWFAYYSQNNLLSFDQLSIVDQSNPILTSSKSIPPEFIPSTYQPFKTD